MRSRPRTLAALYGLILLLGLGLAHASSAQDHVYRYRAADGREVFTNAGNRSGASATATALEEVDLGAVSPTELARLDRSLTRAHDALQSGEHCDAIRASSRVPMRTFLMRAHLRELSIGIGLMAMAVLVLVAWNGRLRGLLPMVPLLGAAYLGYATYGRVDRQQSVLREGLRACSSELPAGAGASPVAVKERLDQVSSLQRMVDRAYEARSALAEGALRER